LRGQVFTVNPSSPGRHGSIDVAIRHYFSRGSDLPPASQRRIVPHFKQILNINHRLFVTQPPSLLPTANSSTG
jgi:hypothetical protein